MAEIGLLKGSGKLLKVGEKSGNFERILSGSHVRFSLWSHLCKLDMLGLADGATDMYVFNEEDIYDLAYGLTEM